MLLISAPPGIFVPYDAEVVILLARDDVEIPIGVEVEELQAVELHPVPGAAYVAGAPFAGGRIAGGGEPHDARCSFCVFTGEDDIRCAVQVDIADRDRFTQLDRMDSIGVFVKELEEELLDSRIDLAVHSLKDMPTLMPAGLHLAAVTERLDPRDVLVTRGELLEELTPGARIGTGSLRRSIQLSKQRPDLKVQSIRGNVDTRLRKVAQGELDGVVLAAAALIRLDWQEKITQYLPTEQFLPSVGQGALVIEIRRDDEEILELVSQINDIPAWQSTSAERAFLSTLGGGCRAPIAALASVDGGILRMTGMAASQDGVKVLHDSIEGEASSAEQIGETLAQKLLGMGAALFIAEVKDR